VQLRIESRARVKRSAGYKSTIEEALEGAGTNAISLMKPMLAHTFEKVKTNLDGAMVQYKYDGNRCLIYNDGKSLIAYSRNGKKIETIDHILSGIDIPVGATLDGEIYNHDLSLQEIVSLIKRKQEDTNKLAYVVYDMISSEPFRERYQKLRHYSLKGSAVLAPAWPIEAISNMKQQLSDALAYGYEGLIVRSDNCGYEVGKRSKSLLKVKAWHDKDFTIIDIVPSKDGWARLVCADEEITFTVSAPGDMKFKEHVMFNRGRYIGKQVRVEYAYLTKDGIPFHPTATLIND
jgi:ATP-dependent DNA ligase